MILGCSRLEFRYEQLRIAGTWDWTSGQAEIAPEVLTGTEAFDVGTEVGGGAPWCEHF